MMDQDCVTFLQWALPKLHLRWQGMRKVRRQVCRRIQQRCRELKLPDFHTYQGYLMAHPEEWAVLETFCRITISRFYRDRAVFNCLQHTVLPELARLAIARNDPTLRCWSAACASGEEAYTLAILWEMAVSRQFPGLDMEILATDVDAYLLERAHHGCYSFSSLKEFPNYWLHLAFDQENNIYRIREPFRAVIDFQQQNILTQLPDGVFHLILCRNLVFTYFDDERQREILNRCGQKLVPGGVLIIGRHEGLPLAAEQSTKNQFEPLQDKLGIYQRCESFT